MHFLPYRLRKDYSGSKTPISMDSFAFALPLCRENFIDCIRPSYFAPGNLLDYLRRRSQTREEICTVDSFRRPWQRGWQLKELIKGNQEKRSFIPASSTTELSGIKDSKLYWCSAHFSITWKTLSVTRRKIVATFETHSNVPFLCPCATFVFGWFVLCLFSYSSLVHAIGAANSSIYFLRIPLWIRAASEILLVQMSFNCFSFQSQPYAFSLENLRNLTVAILHPVWNFWIIFFSTLYGPFTATVFCSFPPTPFYTLPMHVCKLKKTFPKGVADTMASQVAASFFPTCKRATAQQSKAWHNNKLDAILRLMTHQKFYPCAWVQR